MHFKSHSLPNMWRALVEFRSVTSEVICEKMKIEDRIAVKVKSDAATLGSLIMSSAGLGPVSAFQRPRLLIPTAVLSASTQKYNYAI